MDFPIPLLSPVNQRRSALIFDDLDAAGKNVIWDLELGILGFSQTQTKIQAFPRFAVGMLSMRTET